jgi:endonuclease/exonuclease/phosphatase family metal-dependent hydrolase
MKKAKLFFVLLLFAANLCKADSLSGASEETEPVSQAVKIASFNIQIFGVSKMAKPEVVDILVDIVSRADITAIQEVRSVSIDPVDQFMALLPERYDYVIGPREGRSNSKEQYWIIYDAEKFTVLAQETWADETDIFERNPLCVYFRSGGNFDFIIINNHIRPDTAAVEIAALPEVAAYYQNLWQDMDVLFLGDFNADGNYYDESHLADVFPEDGYYIIITNEYDTTVAASENTYDRFIITSSAEAYYTGNFGVTRFDELYDFSRLNIEPRHVSDHYPVWAEFRFDSW